MISKQEITEIIEAKLEGSHLFLLEVKLSVRNVITVVIDSTESVCIEHCVQLSKFLEEKLDRETEDFELNVCSPGLDQAWKDIRQYKKNIGKEVEMILKTGEKLKAILQKVEPSHVEITHTLLKKNPTTKKKEKITETKQISFDEIKSTNLVIIF